MRVSRPANGSTPLVIIAIDGSASSDAALREVARRAWPSRSTFRIVAVVDPRMETVPAAFGGLLNVVHAEDRTARDWVCRIVENGSRTLFEAGLNVSNYIYDGDPKRVLVRLAQEWKPNVIFLGARGLHHGNQRSLGTLAAAVVSRSPCSVEIIRSARGETPVPQITCAPARGEELLAEKS